MPPSSSFIHVAGRQIFEVFLHRLPKVVLISLSEIQVQGGGGGEQTKLSHTTNYEAACKTL